jgi:hypothetical protein
MLITILGKTRCVLLHFDSSKRCVCPLYKFLYDFKVVKLFLKHPVFNCNWVATRWQSYSTHIHTNNTENNTKIHRSKQKINRITQKFGRVRTVPRLCGLYPGICLTTEKKHGKTSVNMTSWSVCHGGYVNTKFFRIKSNTAIYTLH